MTTLKIEIDITGYNEGSLMDQIAAQCSDAIRSNCEKDIRATVASLVKTGIEKRAAELVNEWLQLPLRLTNQYGEAKGEPVPISEYVISKFTDHMKELVRPDGRLPDYYDKKDCLTRLDWIVKKITTDKLEQAVKDAVGEARKQGEDAMRSAVAELMAKHLPKQG